MSQKSPIVSESNGNMLKPLVFICGSTGVGKSALSLSIAKAFNGEVISADSMQVYKGLDVITNKMPMSERQGVEHHLMDFMPVGQTYDVVQFVSDARRLITQIQARNKLPLIVGGTTYYLQHLLYPNKMHSLSQLPNDGSEPISKALPTAFHQNLKSAVSHLRIEQQELFSALPSLSATTSKQFSNDDNLSVKLHSLLQALDPVTAELWHPLDKRKILRSLEIIYSTGQLRSEIIKNQASTADDPAAGFKSLVIWLYADSKKLRQRLDSRIDVMLTSGLLEEIKDLRAISHQMEADSSIPELQKNKGIYQAIGYKEFEHFLNSQNDSEFVQAQLFEKAKEDMRIATRQYATYQSKWLRNSLWPAVRTSNDCPKPDVGTVDLILLDASNLETWSADVDLIGNQIVEDFLNNKAVPFVTEHCAMASDIISKAQGHTKQKLVKCKICSSANDPKVFREDDFDRHIRSRSHEDTKRFKNGEESVRDQNRRIGLETQARLRTLRLQKESEDTQ